MAGDTACSRSKVWFILGGAQRCDLLGGAAVWSLRLQCWVLGPSHGGGLVLDLKLVGHLQHWCCCMGSDVTVDTGAAQVSFLGLWLVS
jgi:hypothetical protein